MQIGTFFGFSVIISASDDDCVGESEVCCPIQFTGTDGLYERGLAFDNVMDSCGQPALPPEKINLFQYSGPVYCRVAQLYAGLLRGTALRSHNSRNLSLFPGRFPAQVFLFGGVNADYFAVGDEQRNHDLEASFELRLLP